MPDPGTFQIQLIDETLFQLLNEDLEPAAGQALTDAIRNAVGRNHFYGAVFASVPEGLRTLDIHVRGQLHTLEAAQNAARDVCKEARDPIDSECLEIGRILPRIWTEETPKLSVEATAAFRQMADQMPGPKVFARSANTTAWSMMSGEGVREDALAECNGKVEAGGFEPDCEIVIAD